MIPNRIYELLPNLHEGIYVVDKDRKITFWNKGAEIITGYAKEEVENNYCYSNILQHIDENGRKLCFGGCPLHRTIKTNKINDTNVYLQHKDGHRVEVVVRTIPIIEDGEVVGAIEAFTDQKFQQSYFKQNQELLEKVAYDNLMGIYNREYLDLYLKQKLEGAEALGEIFGVLFVDVDKFKDVNDTYGHQVGDEILKLIARTISGNVRSNDIVGRYGGDELMILLAVDSKELLKKLSEKLRVLVDNSFYERVSPSITIGASLYQDGDSVLTIVKRADDALYQAKKAGRNTVVVK